MRVLPSHRPRRRKPLTPTRSRAVAGSARFSRREREQRVEARRRPADDPLGQGRHPRQGPPRVPPPADGPQGLDEPQRPLGLRHHPQGRHRSPKDFAGKILVPFPVESALSGVMKTVGADNRLWYRRTFDAPKPTAGRPRPPPLRRRRLGDGRLPSTAKSSAPTAAATTPSPSTSPTPCKAGRQTGTDRLASGTPPTTAPNPAASRSEARRHLYTPITGIWQTVWLEAVPETYIAA